MRNVTLQHIDDEVVVVSRLRPQQVLRDVLVFVFKMLGF